MIGGTKALKPRGRSPITGSVADAAVGPGGWLGDALKQRHVAPVGHGRKSAAFPMAADGAPAAGPPPGPRQPPTPGPASTTSTSPSMITPGWLTPRSCPTRKATTPPGSSPAPPPVSPPPGSPPSNASLPTMPSPTRSAIRTNPEGRRLDTGHSSGGAATRSESDHRLSWLACRDRKLHRLAREGMTFPNSWTARTLNAVRQVSPGRPVVLEGGDALD